MFKRLSSSWELVKASASVLKADKELLMFPVVSTVAMIIVTVSFVVPFVLVGGGDGEELSLPAVAVGMAFYVVSYFVVFFFNAALVGAALIRLRGGDPTLGDGFRIALGKVGLILQYAVVAATVGMVLRAIQERAGVLGKLVSGLFGMAWNLATFLVVPVLVTEDVGPLQAIKRSTALLKQTWGEQVVGNFGVGAIFALAILGVTLLFVPLVMLAGAAQSGALVGVALGAYVLAVVVLALINAALSGIYTAALYRYAAEGELGQAFAPQLVQGAFRPR